MATDVLEPETTEEGGDGTRHRLVKIGNTYYRISERNYYRALMDFMESKTPVVEVVPAKYRMKAITDYPIMDWTEMSSAEAELALMDSPPDKADAATEAQREIAADGTFRQGAIQTTWGTVNTNAGQNMTLDAVVSDDGIPSAMETSVEVMKHAEDVHGLDSHTDPTMPKGD